MPTRAEPSLAIVVPNARSFPTALVTDLLEQMAPTDEVVVVSNRARGAGSSWRGVGAGPPARHSSAFPEGITVMVDQDGGAASARNLGWRSTSAPFVVFLDDDVQIPPGFVDRARSAAAGAGEPAVVGFRVTYLQPRSAAADLITLDRGGRPRRAAGGIAVTDAWLFGVGAALMASRGALEATGGFKDHLGAGRRHGGSEDLEFLWHASWHGTLSYAGSVVVEHASPTVAEVRRKLREYGRAIGRLGGSVGVRPGVELVAGYARNVLQGTAHLRLWDLGLVGATRAVAAALVALAETAGALIAAWIERSAVAGCTNCAAARQGAPG